MLKKLIERVVLKLAAYAENHGNRHVITGGPTDDTPYLIRYILFKSRFGSIYIHRFMRSDADTPHDHPWNFLTYIVSGGYTEVLFDRCKPVEEIITVKDNKSLAQSSTKSKFVFSKFWTQKTNVRRAGSIAYRKATDIHVVRVDKNRSMEEISDAPLTICLLGPRVREWGFWNIESDRDGSIWTDWRQYLNITPDDPRIEGSE